MKSFVRLAVFFLALAPAVAFSQDKKAWPEMDAFHSFMASTFHPAEQGNLQPLRAKADDMLRAAEAWQKSTIPYDYKVDETKQNLQILVKLVNGVADAVHNNADDAKLTALITSAHDAFHQIAEKCRKDDKH